MHGSLHVTIPLLICAEPKGQIIGINFVPNSVSTIQYSSIKIERQIKKIFQCWWKCLPVINKRGDKHHNTTQSMIKEAQIITNVDR